MASTKIGICKFFDSAKGWGFIVRDGCDDDIFVHYKSIQTEGYKQLTEGQLVEYLEVKSEKGLQAHEVVPLDYGTEQPTDTHPPE